YMPLLQAFVLAALALAGALALLRMDPVLVGIATSGPRAPPVPAAEAIRMAEAGLEPGDAAIMARLDRAMGEEEIWRREELSVRALADHVGAPEHRLRRLINGVLGHRNFAAFVNARRIAAAQQALCDPAQARRP